MNKNRVKKELNLNFFRLCRSTTEPSVNLTPFLKTKTKIKFCSLLNNKY